MNYCLEKEGSLLQEEDHDDFFSNRILFRNNSVGCSSRISYYCRSPEGVPFQWERQPGAPKHPPKQDAIPTLSPPPAILSMSLPKPCIAVDDHEERAKRWIPVNIWRKIRKHRRNKSIEEIGLGKKSSDDNIIDGGVQGSNKFENLDFWSCSDGDPMLSSCSPRNSSSSSMSSVSFSNGPCVHNVNDASGKQCPGKSNNSAHEAKRCFPFKFGAILVYATKRI